MRSYSQVSPTFWTGETGREIRKAGRDVQVLALYLMTCPSSNMIGLYYLPMPVLCHETGLDFEGASEALRRVKDLNFALYDPSSEVVFVVEMAKFQIGEVLKPKDNRHKNVREEVRKYRKCCFFKNFMERYAKAYKLSFTPKEDEETEAPSKPLRRGKGPHREEQEQEQEQEYPPPACARVEDLPDETDAVRVAALEAFDQWSHVSRRHGIDPVRNEHAKIFELIEKLATKPPVPLANGVVGQQAMIARAVECMKLKNKPFRDIKFACGCVETELADWSREGLPGANGKPIRAGPALRGRAAFEQAVAELESENGAKK